MTDSHFDRALRAAARRGRADAGPCPDAALLAAYVDRGLSGDERTDVEAHVADCTLCQEQLALLAAVDVADDPPAAPGPSWAPSALLRKWGWLVPIATAILLVAIWVRLPRQEPATALTNAAPTQAVTAQATPQDIEPKDTPRRDAGRDEAPGAAGGRVEAFSARKAPAPPRSDAERQGAGERRKLNDDAANRMADHAATTPTDTLARKAEPSPPPRAMPQAPAAREATAPAAQAATPPESAQRESGRAVGGLMAKSAAPMLLVHAPGGVLVSVAGARIERSIDGGTSWTTERQDLSDGLTVGTCPSADVCWLAGDAAVWVRDAAGEWRRHALPPGSQVTSVVARDARRATIVRSDGSALSTIDAGASWGPAPAR